MTVLTKYREARLPWYTIYSTVPEFSAAVSARAHGQCQGSWSMAEGPAGSVSLYLHIPFCRSVCWYCGFPTTITRQDAAVVCDETRLASEQTPQPLPVSDVHFGGGTPTLIGPAEFLAIHVVVRSATVTVPC
ncbi:hypothetical protein [Mesorhizobium sp. AR07]|uniref:hypothetical protein n=1 Tax=Mesorhizobium sp. AR07 TaxID=2865838 RepID=UPI0039B6F96B